MLSFSYGIDQRSGVLKLYEVEETDGVDFVKKLSGSCSRLSYL